MKLLTSLKIGAAILLAHGFERFQRRPRGRPGASVLVVRDWDRVDPATKNKVPNENEFDDDLQWRPTWSFLRGFSARFRYARVHQYQGPRDTLNEYRAIFNYDFGLL